MRVSDGSKYRFTELEKPVAGADDAVLFDGAKDAAQAHFRVAGGDNPVFGVFAISKLPLHAAVVELIRDAQDGGSGLKQAIWGQIGEAGIQISDDGVARVGGGFSVDPDEVKDTQRQDGDLNIGAGPAIGQAQPRLSQPAVAADAFGATQPQLGREFALVAGGAKAQAVDDGGRFGGGADMRQGGGKLGGGYGHVGANRVGGSKSVEQGQGRPSIGGQAEVILFHAHGFARI